MLKIIKTEDEYENALSKAYDLIQKTVDQSSSKLKELESIAVAIEVYEKEHFPISAPTVI